MIHKLIFLCFAMACPLYAHAQDSLSVSYIKGTHYNETLNSFKGVPFKVDYNFKTKDRKFTIVETINTTVFVLTAENSKLLQRALAKYQRWSRQANEEGVRLTKELGKVSAETTFWKTGGGKFFLGGPEELTLLFASRANNDHRFAIHFPNFRSRYNRYAEHKPRTLYLELSEVTKLAGILSEEGLQGLLDQAQKQSEIESRFK